MWRAGEWPHCKKQGGKELALELEKKVTHGLKKRLCNQWLIFNNKALQLATQQQSPA